MRIHHHNKTHTDTATYRATSGQHLRQRYAARHYAACGTLLLLTSSLVAVVGLNGKLECDGRCEVDNVNAAEKHAVDAAHVELAQRDNSQTDEQRENEKAARDGQLVVGLVADRVDAVGTQTCHSAGNANAKQHVQRRTAKTRAHSHPREACVQRVVKEERE